MPLERSKPMSSSWTILPFRKRPSKRGSGESGRAARLDAIGSYAILCATSPQAERLVERGGTDGTRVIYADLGEDSEPCRRSRLQVVQETRDAPEGVGASCR
jgi:hypothetical protein